jgi:hypothetical protein
MGHRLRMSGEIGDWLTELGSSEVGVAAEVGAALAAVLDSDEAASLAFVTDLGAPAAVEPGDQLAAVDAAYQDLLAWLQLLRREAAEAGSMATASRQRITPAGSWPEPWTEDEIAQGRRREAELTARGQRWQRRVDAFRIRKEAVKARYTAASAARDIQRAIIASAQAVGRVGLDLRGQPEVSDTSEAEAEAELAAAERELTTASAEVGDLLAESARLRHGILGGLSDDDRTPDSLAGVTGGLLEFRACPFAADVRLLCAVEPAGTLTLLAVLAGEPAISSHLARAIGLAGELLAEIRSDGWPADIGEVAFADTATFLHKSFPHLGSYISARSAELAAATTIAGLRRRRGLSLADIAAATGMSESALWKLETSDLRSARIDEVADYVRALGGHLELTAVADHGAPDGSQPVILY